MVELSKLIDEAEAYARYTLLKRRAKCLVPRYHLILPNGDVAVLPALWDNDMQRKILIAMTKEAARKLGAVAVLYMGEVWMLKIEKQLVAGEPIDIEALRASLPSPSESPDRIETVMIVASDGPTTEGLALVMQRDERGRLLALEKLDFGDNGGDSRNGWLGGAAIDGIIPVTKH